MNRSYEGFRILLVHAHPDDETINNGATMALYADRGAHVTLVTCTRGEEGEVLVPSLSHLASSQKDQLGTHRETELADAMKALGISDYRFLGAPSVKFRDSGMMGTEPNNRPDVFWQADVDTAAKILVEIIDEVKQIIKAKESPDLKKWVKSAQVKKMLNLSHGKLQMMRNQKTISYTRIGGTIYYNVEDIERMMDENAIQ